MWWRRATGAVPLARLDLPPATYSGLTLDEPFPDWTGSDRLAFTVVSDLDRPLPLSIRIHDAWHDQRYEDRFNTVVQIRPGSNDVEIPLVVMDVTLAEERYLGRSAGRRAVVIPIVDLGSECHFGARQAR